MMKKSLLKAGLLASAVTLVVVITYSCTKQAETPELKTATLTKTAAASPNGTPFKKTVGAPIDGALALHWVENYNKTNAMANNTSYTIDRKSLEAILSNPACVGIGLHYAVDGNEKLHILPIGVNEGGKLIKTDDINTENGRIDWETAQLWIANHNGPVSSHFFGSNTFGRLFSQPCMAIGATLALDDEHKPQLLLTRKLDGDISINPEQLVEDRSWTTP